MHLPLEAPFTSAGLHGTVLFISLKLKGHWINGTPLDDQHLRASNAAASWAPLDDRLPPDDCRISRKAESFLIDSYVEIHHHLGIGSSQILLMKSQFQVPLFNICLAEWLDHFHCLFPTLLIKDISSPCLSLILFC